MAARATWKGSIRLAELTVPVALYAAATTSQRVAFHILNRTTGNRVHREYVDEETGAPVARDEQVKGYETAKDQYVLLDPEEVAAAVPDGDKTLTIEAFIPCREVDTVYFDRPYFVAPSDGVFADAFAVLREGMRKAGVAALARAVLFRRVRTVLLRTQEAGLIAHTLNFDYEVRSAAEAFGDLPEVRIEGEMLDLARHIIDTKKGAFDPRGFDDRYDAALAELVKAKIEGRKVRAPKRAAPDTVASLMDALRESAKAAGSGASGKAAGKVTGSETAAGKATKAPAAKDDPPAACGGASRRRKAG